MTKTQCTQNSSGQPIFYLRICSVPGLLFCFLFVVPLLYNRICVNKNCLLKHFGLVFCMFWTQQHLLPIKIQISCVCECILLGARLRLMNLLLNVNLFVVRIFLTILAFHMNFNPHPRWDFVFLSWFVSLSFDVRSLIIFLVEYSQWRFLPYRQSSFAVYSCSANSFHDLQETNWLRVFCNHHPVQMTHIGCKLCCALLLTQLYCKMYVYRTNYEQTKRL